MFAEAAILVRQMTAPELFADGLTFPEGPRWYESELWLSDIHAHKVLAFSPEGHRRTVAEVPQRPSGLGFHPDGTPIVVSVRDKRLLKIDPAGGTSLLADLADFPGNFLNDMVVDQEGRAYVGYRHDRGYSTLTDHRSEGVILVTRDGSARLAADGMSGPNGSVVTPDGKTLIVAESHASRLTAFDIAADGSLDNRRVFAELEAGVDGCCLDADGQVWVAARGECQRYQEGGEVTARVTPVSPGFHPLACALGGQDRRTLYILCLRSPASGFPLNKDTTLDHESPLRGLVEQLRVETPGAGLP
jgi:sugar lactone lactonase YvrE